MRDFQLSPLASKDFFALLANLEEHRGETFAREMTQELIAAFRMLAENPGLGHLRPDLTTNFYYFFPVEPFLIIYERRVDPLPVIRILHASRDIKKVLRRR